MLVGPGTREIGRGPGTPIPISDEVGLALVIVLELVAIVLAFKIWREPGRSRAGRALWAIVTLVPVLGLIAYAAWRDPPPPSDPTDRPPER